MFSAVFLQEFFCFQNKIQKYIIPCTVTVSHQTSFLCSCCLARILCHAHCLGFLLPLTNEANLHGFNSTVTCSGSQGSRIQAEFIWRFFYRMWHWQATPLPTGLRRKVQEASVWHPPLSCHPSLSAWLVCVPHSVLATEQSNVPHRGWLPKRSILFWKNLQLEVSGGPASRCQKAAKHPVCCILVV